MSTLLPPAMMLLWSGAAATLVAALVLAPLLGEGAGALALAPRRASLPQALLLGLLVLPLVYGTILSLSHEANLLTGAFLGSMQAAVLAFRSIRLGGRELLRENTNRCLLSIAYGALFGFTYVTP